MIGTIEQEVCKYQFSVHLQKMHIKVYVFERLQ